MKKLLLTLLTCLAMTSCTTYQFYMHEPFNNPPVLEDDSVRLWFYYTPYDPMKIFAHIYNKTEEPIHVIWKESSIDSMEIQFRLNDVFFEYQPQEIKPNEEIEKPMAIRKFYANYIVPMFDEVIIDAWGLEKRRVILTIDFGNRKKAYDMVLGVAKAKRRLKEPPQYKKEYYETPLPNTKSVVPKSIRF
ncbi:MAG: hypothetical protein J5510_02595 [Prevotella sp.]|nr:hypothetical protein [Prevotella sp.]